MFHPSTKTGLVGLRPWLLAGSLGLLALTALKSAPVHADPPAVAGVTWTPTFSDQFAGTSLDASKWETGFTWADGYHALGGGTFDYFGANGNYAGYPYFGDPNFPAVTVDGSGLSLRTKREDYTDRAGTLHHYTSGAVNTDRSFAQIYGYFECNYQVATEAGIDPAFWLYTRSPNETYLPGVVELDVLEAPSYQFNNGIPDTTGDLIFNYVHPAYGVNLNIAATPDPNTPYVNPTPLEKQSHTYGVDWEPGTMTFYLDGNVIRSLTYTAPASGQQPLSMRVNQELENDHTVNDGTGHWYGYPDDVVNYATKFAHVRSVKAWTRSGSAELPYPSLPSFPGTVQAANYDTGGPGISYNQSRNGYNYSYNRPYPSGAAYSNSQDGSTPGGIGATSTGQWYKYTVNVATAGTYTLSFAVNTNNDGSGYTGAHGGRMHLEDWNTATATGTWITGQFNLNSPQANTNTYVDVTVTAASVHLTAGTHVFRWVQDFRDYGDDFNLYSMTATLTQADEGPYNGPHNIPGTLNAADYDTGGQGTAYNQGPVSPPQTGYRTDNSSALYGNGIGLGWTWGGQSYKYTVNVTATGPYAITVSQDSPNGGGTFHLEDEHGTNLTGSMVSRATGDWVTPNTVTAPLTPTLTAGPHVLTWVQDSGGYNLLSMTFAPAEAPYDGPHNVPGTIQSDDYDTGGEGTGYHIVPPATPQAGTGYRADNNTHVYAESAPGGNGYVLGWSGAGDWYRYGVNVTAAASYTATFQVQTGGPGGTFHLEDENGNNLTGTLTAPDTGGWGSAYWKTVASPAFALTAGAHTLRLVEDTVVAGGWVCDFSWMQLAAAATGALITGTEFDDGAGPWGGNQANAASNAFDGDPNTFYDCANATGYVGLDAGVPTTVSSIAYAPRAGYEARMVGGVFEGSNTSPTAGYVTLGTVTATPADGLVNSLTVSNATPYRWLRYRDSQGGYCNVAEVQFVDPPVGVPAVPVLKAVAGIAGTKKVSLSWGAVSGATSYHILRSLASGYKGTKALAVNVKGVTYTDSGLTAGTTYYYKITAVNAKGGSVASAQVSAKAL